MYKNAKDKGITLTSLIVTVVILLILSTIAYETGKGTIENARLSAYRAEMTIMQEEVDKFEQNIRQGNITESALTQYGQNPTEVEGATEALQNAGITNAEDQSGYKYYSAEALKQLGIENVENDFLINIAKRSVVSVNGVKYHGEKYYTLSEVPGGKYIVENQPIESSVTFDATSDVQGNGMKIIISNITYIGNVKKGSIYYRHEEDEAGKWIRVKNETTDTSCTIDVLREGTYQVKVVPTTDREEKNVVPVEVPVYQANYVIAETGTKYVTLAEAFREATSGQTITQTRNCADSSDAKISGKSVILNNNNRNITKKTNPIIVESGATLEISGKGTIATTDGITAINNHGTLTVGKTEDSLSTSSPSIQGGNYGIETDGTFNFYNGVIKGTTDAFNTEPTAIRENYDVIAGTETINGTLYKTATLGISTITVNAPTNLAVSTAGIVTWDNSSNATGYQISIDGTNYTDATSGIDYLSVITETPGEKTIYVKAINSDEENYESTNASIATVTTNVYTVTFESNDTSKGTVTPTSKNVIAGATYQASENTLTLEGITSGTNKTTLVTVTATAKNGCNLSGWSGTSGNIINNTTITATFNANPINFENQTKNVTYSTTEQTVTIAGASNGTGTYTYAEKTEKNQGGTDTNYISINETTITIKENTPADTYTYVVTAKDSGTNVTKDATITIIVGKQTVEKPTNVAVSTGGFVTWTNSSNATGYEISIDGTNWQDATSGIDYLNTITNTAGNKTIYVRGKNSDNTNYETNTNSTSTATVTVYLVTFQSNNLSMGAVDTANYKVIKGATVGVSGNKLTIKGKNASGTDVNLKTVTAVNQTGYSFSTWSITNGSEITGATTIIATFVGNELAFSNQTVNKTYSTSLQTAEITKASNGTGTYTYTEKSEKNQGGTNTNYITITPTTETTENPTINIAANTPADTYTYVVTATDSGSGKTAEGTITVVVGKQKVNKPTNLAVTTGGYVKWTESENATGYQISVNSNFTGATNVTNGDGTDYLSSIIATTGNRMVYVRAINSDTTNYETSDSEQIAVTVYELNFASNDTTMGTVNPASYNVISGVTYETNNNVITIKGKNEANVDITLNNVTANANTGYTFSNWSSTGGTVTSNENITATFTVNSYVLTRVLYSGNNETGTNKNYNTKYTATELAQPTRTGYTFRGWYNNDSYATELSTTSDFNTANATFTDIATAGTTAYIYAKWDANSLTFEDQTKNVTYSTSSQTVEITGASNGTGTYTYTEKSEKNQGGTDTNYISINGTTITIKENTPANTYTYVVTAKDSGTNVTKDATITIIVGKQTVAKPTGLAVSTAGFVTWTESGNATSYEISIDGTNFTDATSGINYIDTITNTAGNKTIYVRGKNSDTTNYETNTNSTATVTVTVYLVTFQSNNLSMGAVDTANYKVIRGTTVGISGNTLTLRGKNASGTNVNLKTVRAVNQTGYSFSTWSIADGSTISGTTTITATFAGNALTFPNKTINKTFSTTEQTEEITKASNGTGTYTYTEKSEKNQGGTNTSYITVTPTTATTSNPTIKIAANTPANTYTVVVTATDSGSGETIDATITVVVGKADNPITIEETQICNTVYSTSSQTTNVTAATNAQGNVTYTIQSQKDKNSSNVTYFTMPNTTSRVLTMAASAPVSGSSYTVVVRATAAGNSNYKDGYKDITITVTVGKATNPIAVTATQTLSTTFSTTAQSKAFTAATNAQGNVTYTIQSQKNTGGTTVTNFSIPTSNSPTLGIKENTPVNGSNYTVVVRATAAGNENYNEGYKDITLTVTIGKATVGVPTNLAISTGGIVTWTAAENATSYEISTSSNSGFINVGNVTSYDYLSTLTADAINKTVYVRAINSDTVNYTTPSNNASKSVTLYTLTFTSNNTTRGTITPTSYIAINGATFETLNNTVVIKGKNGVGTDIILETVTATANENYEFKNWSTESGTVNSSQTIRANFDGKVYTITLNNGYATTAGTTTIYEKYNEGYYLERSCTNKLTSSINPITIPDKTDYIFNGYFTEETGGTKYISETGYLSSASTTNFTDDGTLYAQWDLANYIVNDTTLTSTLKKAYDIATDGQTIKVLRNVEDSSSVFIAKNITLDLQTYTVTRTVSITINSAGTLTINGSGKFESTASYDAINNSGTLIINGGTIEYKSTNTAIHNSGTVTLNSGTISSTASSGSGVWNTTSTATANILGGKISVQSSYAVNSGVINIGDSTKTLSTTSPLIISKSTAISSSSSGTWNFYNGIIKATSSPYSVNPTNIRDGYAVATGTETIDETAYKTAYLSEPNYSITADGTTKGYIDLYSANAAATDGQTIKVLKNVEDNSAAVSIGDKSITIDLQTYTVTRTKAVSTTATGTMTIQGTTGKITNGTSYTISNAGTFNLQGGTIENTNNYAINNITSGIVNINGGTVQGTTRGISQDSSGARGTINISGGIVKTLGTSGNRYGIFNQAGSGYTVTVNISGGEIYGGTYGIYSPGSGTMIVNIGDPDVTLNITTPIVSGGTYGIYNGSNATWNFYNGVVKGTTYGYNIAPTIVRTGYNVSEGAENIDGTVYKTAFLAVPNYSITTGTTTTYFETLASAYNVATTGQTIKLLQNYTDTSAVAISKNIILDLQTYTLERNTNIVIGAEGSLKIIATGSTGTLNRTSGSNYLFTINNGGTFELASGNITDSTTSISIYNYGVLKITGGTIIKSGTGIVISNNGQLDVDGGRIEGYAETIRASGGSLVNVTGGTIISTNSYAINANSGSLGIINIGNSLSTFSTTTPVIMSLSSYAINLGSASNTWNFYNGILKAKSTIYIKEPTNVRTGYAVATGTEDIDGVTYKTAYLQEANYSIDTETTSMGYLTLNSALSAATDGQTIKVLRNVEDASTNTPSVNEKSVTLDLQTYTVSITSRLNVNSTGSLTITGTTGKITSSNNSIIYNGGGTITLLGGTIENTDTRGSNYGRAIEGKGIFNIYGGNISSLSVGLYLYNNDNNNEINITGGSITAGYAGLHIWYCSGNVNITGGTIEGDTYGILCGYGSSSLNIGDQTIAVNNASPVIFGATKGIYCPDSNYPWNFYNGILKGTTCYDNTPTTIRDGYYVKTDTENIGGTTYNTAYLSNAKENPTLTLSPTTGSVNYNAQGTFTATASVAGTISVTSSDTNKVAIVSGDNESVTSNTAKTITYRGAGATTNSTTITVTFTPTDTGRYNTVTKTYTVSAVNKINPTVTLSAPNGSVTYNQENTFTATPNIAGKWYVTSGNTTYVTITSPASGTNVTANTASTITYKGVGATTNATTISVRFVPTDTTNYNEITPTYSVIKVNQATPSLSLNPTSGTIIEHYETTSTITYTGDGTLNATPSNSNIATASISGRTLTITAKAAGTTTITVSANAGTNYTATTGSTNATYTVTVLPANYSITASGTTSYYNTLATAMAAVGNNQTIKVLNSVTETDAPVLASGKTGVKLDMNGKTTTLDNVTLTNNGELDIYSSVDGGKLTSSVAGATITNNGTLTTNGTTGSKTISITNISNSAYAYVITNNSGKTATLNTNTTLTFETAIATSYSRYLISDYGILNIQGAILTNTITGNQYDRGVYITSADGRVAMTSGTINTYSDAIYNGNGTGIDTPAISISGTTSGTTITSTNGNAINNTKGTAVINGGTYTSSTSYAVRSSGTSTITNIISGSITSQSSNAIYSGGGIINVRGGTITTTNKNAIYGSSGTVNISGGTISSTSSGNGSSYSTISNQSSATFNITGGEITATDTNAITSFGPLNISGGTITSTNGYGISLSSSSTATISGNSTVITGTTGISASSSSASSTITGGTITGTNGKGVDSSGTLTLGTDDGTVTSSASAKPSITGSGTNYGVQVSSTGTFNFYDGVIKGGTGRSISKEPDGKPAGYGVQKTTSGSVETAILDAAYTVEYYNGTTLLGTSNHVHGMPSNLTKFSTFGVTNQGYEIKGWATSSSSTTVAYTDENDASNLTTTPGATIPLYVLWKAAGNTPYKVEHWVMDTSGNYPSATSTENLTGTTGETLTLANLKKTTAGTYYVANGIDYSYGQVGGTTVNTTTIAADGSTVIKLYYARTKGKLTTAKGTNVSGVTTQNAVEYYYGATVPTLTATLSTATGYTIAFDKWTSSNSAIFGNITTNPTGTVTWPAMANNTSITLTASATKTANTYTIAYNLDGGTAGTNAPTSGTYDANVLIDNPTKTGYTFAGWTSSATNGLNTSTARRGTTTSPSTTWTGGATTNRYFKNLRAESGTVTLTATWTANTYQLYRVLYTGSESRITSSKAYNSAYTTSELATPTRAGYTFDGWYNNSSYATSLSTSNTFTTTTATFANVGTTGTIARIYAKWTANDISFANQNKSLTFSTSSQDIAITSATNGTGSYTYTEKSETKSGTATSYISISGTTITVAANTPVGAYTYVITATDNGSGKTADATYTITIVQQQLATPTVSVSTAGYVTWSAVSNATSYEIATNSGFTENKVTATNGNGTNYLSKIIASTGSRTVYVRAISTNTNYKTSENGIKAVDVAQVNFASNNTSMGTVNQTGIKVISGTTVSISSNVLKLKGITTGTNTTDLITVTATNKTGYNFSSWSESNGSTITGTTTKTITATFVGNELTFTNQTVSKTFSTSSQTVTITGASNGTGTYKYTEKSEKNSSNASTSYITVTPTTATTGNPTINIAENTPADTYTYVVTATDNGSGATVDATITITVTKAANPITLATTQTWSATYSASAQTTNVTAATNAQGSVTYTIQSQKNASNANVTYFTMPGTTSRVLTMSASTPVSGSSYKVVVRASAAGNNNYEPGTADITITVTIAKATNPITVRATQSISATYSSSAQNKTFTAATNAEGTVTYEILFQEDREAATVSCFSIPTNTMASLRLTGGTSVFGSRYTVRIRATATGNDNYNSGSRDITITVTINQAASSLSLNPTSGTIIAGNQTTSTITYTGDGTLSVGTSNSSVATASISGTTLTITGVGEGTATITVSAGAGTNYAAATDTTYTITVKAANYSITASSTTTYYETLATAMAAVANNQTIKVLKGVTETNAPSLASGKTGVKLDMNGMTTTLNNITLTNNGELDIYSSADGGKLTGTIANSSYGVITNNGTLTTSNTTGSKTLSITNTSSSYNARVIVNNASKTATLKTNTTLTFETAMTSSTSHRYLIDDYGILNIQGATLTNTFTVGITNGGINVVHSNGRVLISSGIINTRAVAVRNESGTGTTTPAVEISETTGTTNITTYGEAIYNFNDTGKIAIRGGSITASNSYAIQNFKSGTIDISGGIITSGNMTAAYNNVAGTINISGGSVTGSDGVRNNGTGRINVTGGTITGTSTGVAGQTGTVTISGSSTNITGTTRGLNMTTGTATITGGTISATNGQGVYATSGTITVGTNDGTVTSSATSQPSITGAGSSNGYGVQVTSTGTFNFYDGVVKGATGQSISKEPDDTPTGYVVKKTTSGSQEIATLALPPDTLRLTSSETSSTSKFLNGTLKRSEIEKVTFVDTGISGHSTSDANCWDVSSRGNGDILAWYTDSDSDGYYEVTIGSNDGRVKANTNSSYLLCYIGYNGDDTTCIAGIDNLDTSQVTNMSYMFIRCGYTAMTSLDLGDKFDTSQVTNMSYMFYYCGSTAMTSLDLGDKFDTSQVTDMLRIFYYCGSTAMTSLDLGDKFDTSQVTNMSLMFYFCGSTAMTSLDLGDKFDTSQVTDMSRMFYYCGSTAMTSLDLGDKFDTSQVTNMSYMFYYCGSTAMTSLDLGDKFDTSQVTNMSYMFSYCGRTAMTSLDLGDKFDTSLVTNMSNMFCGCGYTAMTSLDLGDKFDTSQVTNMSNMFGNCGRTAMTSLDLGDKFDTSQVTNMDGMFGYCGSAAMTSLDISAMTFPSTLTSYTSIFNNCGKSTCVVYVKNNTARSWVITNKNTNWSDSNIIVGSH